MKKTIILTLLIICIILLSGCKYISGSGSDSTPAKVDYRTGTKGLEIRYQKDMPPDELYLNQPFSLGLEIKNDGATDVMEGYVTIINPEKYYMTFHDSTPQTRNIGGLLPGKGSFNPDGGYKFMNFNMENLGIPETEDSHTFLFKALSCYKYKTAGTATICINPRMYDFFNFITAACKVGDVSLSGGQGAPIAITKVSQRVIPSEGDSMEIQFFIDIENVNKGLVTPIEDYFKKCNKEPAPHIGLNRIKKEDIRVFFSNQLLSTCKAPIIDQNKPNKATITCTSTITKNKGSYTTPLVIQFDYGYVSQEYEKKVTVNRNMLGLPCPPSNCMDKTEFGVCSVFGGENREMTCEDVDQKCCKRPESQPDCGYLPELTDYTCTEQACNSEYMKSNACMGDNYCCKKDKLPDCPSGNCQPKGQCVDGYGGPNSEKTCANDLECCMYPETEGESCGSVGDTAGYECMETNSWGYHCKANLCKDEHNKFCCKYYEANCDQYSGNCRSGNLCYRGYGGIIKDENVRCEEKGDFCCVHPEFPTEERIFPDGAKGWCDYLNPGFACTYDEKLKKDVRCNSFLCPGITDKCCPTTGFGI